MESCSQMVDSGENNRMRLNVCAWGRKMCDDLASKRDTESVSSENSHQEPRRLTQSLEPRNAQITGSLASYLDSLSSAV